jgi:hypothetical protein
MTNDHRRGSRDAKDNVDERESDHVRLQVEPAGAEPEDRRPIPQYVTTDFPVLSVGLTPTTTADHQRRPAFLLEWVAKHHARRDARMSATR